MKITEQWLKKHDACSDGIKAFCAQKETDSTKILKLLIKSNEKEKLEWANWLIVKLFRNNKQRISYVIFVAKLVLNIFEEKYPGDLRPRKAIEAAEKYLKNPTQRNKNASDDAARAARVASDDAARVARAASDDAASDAASAAWATWAVAYAVWGASDAAYAVWVVAYAVWGADAASAADDYNKTLIKILKYGITLL